MAASVKQAKHALHNAQHERQEKAAAWWQQAVIEGRVLRQARAEMTAGERQTQQDAPRSTTRAPRPTAG